MQDRTYKVTFRMNEKEYQSFKKKVTRSKLKQSDFLRTCVAEKEIIVVPGLEEFAKQILAIGNNLNQVAKNLNSHYFVNTSEDIEKVRQDLGALREEAIEVLQKIRS